MLFFPNAKINLGLHILRKRKDDFHDLETCFYPVEWNDVLEIHQADKFTFKSTGISIPSDGNKNLCEQAYDLLAKDYDLPQISLHLHKNIPIGAGLGGGSADATMTLLGINEMFSLGISKEKLAEYALELGSDCPFFVYNEPTLAYGRGDDFEAIDFSLKGKNIIMINPNIHISTGEAYRAIIPQDNRESLKDILLSGNIKGKVVNDFAVALSEKYSFIKEIETYCYEKGAWFAGMSGSGSTMFAIFEEEIPNLEFPEDYSIWKGILK